MTRKRKKWLKKHGLYVNPRDTWNLDYTLAEYILPRLKLFKEVTNAYPGCGEMNTPEKWHAALDKMILAFTLVKEIDDLSDKYYPNGKFDKNLWEEDGQKIQEGLHLFAEYFMSLWW